ncbi:MAG: hypothetical protein Q9219_007417 [cf. Caloplaca sp. 3 TL-2023]
MVRSAFVGQPPLTDDDYWTVKGSLLAAGLMKLDPNKGLKLPPPRPPPDQYHFETRGPAIMAVSAVLIAIMIGVTVARLMLRGLKRDMKFGMDDWLIMPSLVLGILWPILMIVQVKTCGFGKHLYDVSYHELYMGNWIGSAAKIVFFVGLGFIKLSIVSFNMRLTGLSSKKWMYAHWTFFGLVVIFMVATVFLYAFQCTPAAAGWNSIATGHLSSRPKCRSDSDIGDPLSVIHIVMDFCLLAVPIIVLWKTKVPSPIKIRLYLLFSVGCVTCISAVMRQVSQGQLAGRGDITYNVDTLIYWTEVDITLSIVVASLPVLGIAIGHKASGSKASKPSFPSSSSKSNPISKVKASGVRSQDSREGIIRHDEIELEYHEREPGYMEDGMGMGRSHGLHGPNGHSIYDEQHAVPWTAEQR